MLEVSNIDVFHDDAQALREVSFRVDEGEIVGLMGRNGAGKTTTLRAIMGTLPISRGCIRFDGEELSGLAPHLVPKRGLALVPQGRRLFNAMSVADNLAMGMAVRDNGAEVRETVLDLLPVLRQRLSQRAGTLSGGEQQMLAIARALCSKPRLILLDEPSEGLVPEIIDRLLDTVAALKQQGVAVLLVEQRVKSALRICDRILLMENGEIRHQALALDLKSDPEILERYIGVHR